MSENGASENITVSVPVAISYIADKKGNLTAPSPSALRIENESSREVRVSAVTAFPEEGWNLVLDAKASEADKAVSGRVGPAADMLDLAECEGGKEVSDKLAWTMAQKDYSESLSQIQLEATGAIANVSRDEIEEATKIAAIQWSFEDDTVTNALFDQIEEVEDSKEGMADEIAEITRDAEEQAETLGDLAEASDDTMKNVGANPPSNTANVWIDTSDEGVFKYFDGTAWVSMRSVWG